MDAIRRRSHQKFDRSSTQGRTRQRHRYRLDQTSSGRQVSNTATTKPERKIFALSPWPMETYWNWTKAVDPEDYVIA
jgi:hypothetical protein